MSTVFLDTSGLIALVNTDDQWNEQAELVWTALLKQNSRFLTSSWVLAELGDSLSSIKLRPLACQITDSVRASDRIEIVAYSDSLDQQGWHLYRSRQDKEWGITDCISFIIMQQKGLIDAFTSDHHFEQAGFNVLIN